ncbi:MAG: hypothetical protein K8953_13265, partial [Proteobacteria bacterium]|nr:hypothetical protein [Pseudomonadota bacterium]
MTYIKILTVLAGLALLTACGGAAPPNTDNDNGNGGTSVPCDMNPFGTTCGEEFNPRRVAIVSDCRTDDTGDFCTDATTFVCGKNIRDGLCRETTAYKEFIQRERTACLARTNSPEACDEEERIATCDADAFSDNCADEKYMTQRERECEAQSLKNTQKCMATEARICGATGDFFDPFCEGITNYVSVRETACQTHGTDATDGDPICATILIPFCTIADPFAHDGCDDVEGIDANIRTPYCQTPANAWNPKCMDGMHGTVTDTRVTACQMFGTNTGMGGDNSCATSLTTACDIRDPFAYTGCNNVAGIEGVRTMYCETPATAWDEECMQTIHGDVTNKRGEACLKFGIDTITGGHATCISNTVAESSCRMNPFDPLTLGCAILTEFPMIVKTYCMNNDVADCPNATYGDWVKSFGDNPPPATLTAGKNQFLAGGTATLDTMGATNATADNLTLASAMFNGMALVVAGEASDGVAFFYDTIASGNYNYYAGILSDTDLGAPITGTAETTAKWDGQLKAFRNNAGTIVPDDDDFVLDITFAGNTGKIESYVLIDADEDAYYHLKGEYNAQGVISGSVNYGEFMGVGTARVTEGDDNSEGILTGLIGEQGAVGAFIGGTGTKEALVATTNTAYVGGFVAAPYIPEADDFPRKVTFNDWVRDFGRSPPPASLDTSVSATDRKRQFWAGGTEALDTTGTGSIATATPYGLTLASAMYNRAPLTTTGDANDGYGLLVDTVATNNYVYYAGILSGTDLGAPLIQTSGKFDWHGQIQITRQNRQETLSAEDFTLHITLGAVPGIAGSAGSISGFYGEGTPGSLTSPIREYRLAGTYYTNGVIDGTALYTTIIGNNEPINSSGFLTGLMGEQGAVGVFIAGTGTKESIIGAASARVATLYAGGFVVSGAAPPSVYVPPGDNDTGKVAFNDWLRDFGENRPPLTLRETNPPADRKNEFLAGTATALTTTGAISAPSDANISLTLNSARYGGAVLGGTRDINDGVAFFYDTIAAGNYNYYAGLLSDTDLGAPITGSATTTAKWEGQFRAFRDNNGTIETDDTEVIDDTGFVLDITFAGNTGSIESYVEVAPLIYYHLDGTYDDQGVISGKVNFGTFVDIGGGVLVTQNTHDGILTGLIGEQGAVVV